MLRAIAFRQIRGVVLVPAVIGAVAGNIAASRLGGERVEWLLAGAAFGALASFAVWGSALVASSVRASGRGDANLIGAGVVVQSGEANRVLRGRSRRTSAPRSGECVVEIEIGHDIPLSRACG